MRKNREAHTNFPCKLSLQTFPPKLSLQTFPTNCPRKHITYHISPNTLTNTFKSKSSN
jgi:hypothetical protein